VGRVWIVRDEAFGALAGDCSSMQLERGLDRQDLALLLEDAAGVGTPVCFRKSARMTARRRAARTAPPSARAAGAPASRRSRDGVSSRARSGAGGTRPPAPSPRPRPPSAGSPPLASRRRFAAPAARPDTSGNATSNTASNAGRSCSSFTRVAASASRSTSRSTPATPTAATASIVSDGEIARSCARRRSTKARRRSRTLRF